MPITISLLLPDHVHIMKVKSAAFLLGCKLYTQEDGEIVIVHEEMIGYYRERRVEKLSAAAKQKKSNVVIFNPHE